MNHDGRTRLHDRSRAAGRYVPHRGREEATVCRITGELAGLAERAVADAEKLLANERRALRRARTTQRMKDRLQ
jgi:transposase, IS5 family